MSQQRRYLLHRYSGVNQILRKRMAERVRRHLDAGAPVVIEEPENGLPLATSDTVTVASLPFYHRDPFDRILIAQALTEQMPIISSDSAIDAYGVNRVWQG